MDGGCYRAIEPNAQDWRWSQELRLYLEVVEQKLRYLSEAGKLILTPAEAAEQAQL